MLYKMIVENLSERILHVAQNESRRRGDSLCTADKLGDKQFLWLTTSDIDGAANIISTLETDRNVRIVSVEDTSGNPVEYYTHLKNTLPAFDRNTLKLVS